MGPWTISLSEPLPGSAAEAEKGARQLTMAEVMLGDWSYALPWHGDGGGGGGGCYTLGAAINGMGRCVSGRPAQPLRSVD